MGPKALLSLLICLVAICAISLVAPSPQEAVAYEDATAIPGPEEAQVDETAAQTSPSVDASAPEETPDGSSTDQPEAKENKSASNAGAARAGSASVFHRDRKLFDGDGYLFDRRAEACASGDGKRFPVLSRLLGVDRRQSRRANGCGLFACRN